MRIPRWTMLLFAVFLLSVGLLGVAAGADGSYELSMSSAVDVPERTIENPENESEEFTITTVGRTTHGDSAVVDVSPPDESLYSVFFRDQDGSAIDVADRIRGSQSIEFNVGSEPAGSYVVTAGESSTPESVLPVVIEGYSVTTLELDGEQLAGSTVTTNSSHNVTVELTERSNLSITTVTLTLWTADDGVVHEVSLEQSGDDATVFEGSLSDAEAGEYNAQVRIRGGDTVDGEPELIGLSDNDPLTVESHSSNDNDGTDGDSSTDGSDDSATGSGDDTGGSDDESNNNTTDTDSTNDTDTDDGDDTVTNGTDDVTNGTSADTDESVADNDEGEANGTTDSQSSNNTNDTTDSDGVIEPNTNNTDDSTPLHAVPLLLALLVVTGVIRRLHHR